MGCSGSLTIFLSRELADDAVVRVTMGEDEAYTCATEGQLCQITEEDGAPVLVVPTSMGAPESVEVEVSEGGAAAVSYDVTPDWGDPFYPNGKACDGPDGGCVGGEADLAL